MAEVSATGNRVRLSKVYRVYHDELQVRPTGVSAL